MSAAIPHRSRGTALFSYGFRPFFLFSAVWAAIAVPIWMISLALGHAAIGASDGRAWHIHEMLFGYLAGVIAGFLLTAVPNWTGRLPVTGWRLASLFGLWVAGRVAGFLPPALSTVAAVVDCAFLVALAAVLGREVWAGRNLKNLPVCLMVSVLAGANIAWHFVGVQPAMSGFPERAGLAVAVGLIAIIGGRIVPSFTSNWMQARGLAVRPAPIGRFDHAVLFVTAAGLVTWVAVPWSLGAAALLVAAGFANLARLVRWRGWAARSDALVWVLHVGYAWVGVGLVLLGLSAAGLAPRTAGIHALTAGAVGVMTLAVMTRASLGHTGRERIADRWTLVLYLLVILAAILRVVAAFAGGLMIPLLLAASACWTLAFATFALRYGPMLWLPRREA